MRHDPARPDSPMLLLAHGAGAGHTHPWMRRVATGLATRGVQVVTFDFPYRAAGRGMPDKAPVLEQAFADAWVSAMTLAGGPLTSTGAPRRLFAGGKSMGGRISSQLAARQGFVPPLDGLVFFGYPLHPPGKPTQRRDRHLPDIDRPMLFFHGSRDPFGTPDEMTALVESMPLARLVLVDQGDHSLIAPKRADPKGAALDRVLDQAADWMLGDQR